MSEYVHFTPHERDYIYDIYGDERDQILDLRQDQHLKLIKKKQSWYLGSENIITVKSDNKKVEDVKSMIVNTELGVVDIEQIDINLLINIGYSGKINNTNSHMAI
ncbi:3753_t:CDS:2 [Entrophospora sp. SA101]|nr:3753_t:CDS:2 [Entrophospora sp. SA101]